VLGELLNYQQSPMMKTDTGTMTDKLLVHLKQELSYHKQMACQLRTQQVGGIYRHITP